MKRLHSDVVSEESDPTCFYPSSSPFPSPKRQCVAREFSASPSLFAPSPSSPFSPSPAFPQYPAFQPQPFYLNSNNTNSNTFGSPLNNSFTASQPPDPSTLGRGLKRQLGYDGGDENISTNISNHNQLNNNSHYTNGFSNSLFDSRPTNHDTFASAGHGCGDQDSFCSAAKRRRCGDGFYTQQQQQQQPQQLLDPSSRMDTDTLPAASGNNGWLPEDLQMVPYGWEPGRENSAGSNEDSADDVIPLDSLQRIYAPPSPLALKFPGAVGALPSRALLPWNAASEAAARRWAFNGQVMSADGEEECAEEDTSGLLFVDEQELRQYQQQLQTDEVNGANEEIYLYHPSRMAHMAGGLVDENNVPLPRFHECDSMAT
eukprot:gnl/Hemi2/5785_TR1994_c0_g1_i1.p1 gnl/Hemi2/5785_TR1994_c0_g1~~gnl/Hemi2/5785_TR1994_c0_g1_i1.p1  ORF type:complete len:373 (-),score=120.08 gnl/Hemi2/5785_TR1994_c0_g1_i1:86-1204(-)